MTLSLSEQATLVLACHAGDSEAFGQLYELFVEPIYNFIYYKTHHKETAEDLTSQTFFKALDSIKKCDPEQGSFSSWVYRIARNTVIDHYRTKKHHANIEDAFDIGDNNDAAKALDHRLELGKVKEYLKKLNVEQRDILILRLWQEMSFQEIAQIIHKSEAGCKMMFGRTLTKLRTELSTRAMLLFLCSFVINSIWTI